MNKKSISTISTILLLILTIFSNIEVNQALVTRDWEDGTTIRFIFEEEMISNGFATNETLSESLEYKMTNEIIMNITEIDEINKLVTFTEKFLGGYTHSFILDYSAINVSNDLTENFFDFDYDWDSNFNRAVLFWFDINFYDMVPFLEPNWEVFNNNFVNILNTSAIIAELDTGYEIKKIELGDFFDGISFSIMNKETISEAKNAFNSENHKWSFEFDLSNYALMKEYNQAEGYYEYFQYDQYTVNYKLEYSEGGILELSEYYMNIAYTRENLTSEMELRSIISSKDGKSVTIDFNLYSVFLALLVIPVVLILKRKRK